MTRPAALAAAAVVLVACALAGALACAPRERAGVSVRSPVFVPGAGFAPGVLYARIDNPTAQADTLMGVAIGNATSAMLHMSATDSTGRISMKAVVTAALPARGTLWLAPGGLHAMIEGLTPRPARGDSVTVAFRFARASEIRTFARVIDYSDVDSLTRRAKETP